MNDSHYHSLADAEDYPVEYPGIKDHCPICNPQGVKSAPKPTPVPSVPARIVQAPESTEKPNLLKLATNPPTSRKMRP